MSIIERLDQIAFNRELRIARKRFRRVCEKADRLRMPKKEKRSLMKSFLRAAGYKKLRIKERD